MSRRGEQPPGSPVGMGPPLQAARVESGRSGLCSPVQAGAALARPRPGGPRGACAGPLRVGPARLREPLLAYPWTPSPGGPGWAAPRPAALKTTRLAVSAWRSAPVSSGNHRRQTGRTPPPAARRLPGGPPRGTPAARPPGFQWSVCGPGGSPCRGCLSPKATAPGTPPGPPLFGPSAPLELPWKWPSHNFSVVLFTSSRRFAVGPRAAGARGFRVFLRRLKLGALRCNLVAVEILVETQAAILMVPVIR